jgi:hypothetical protein
VTDSVNNLCYKALSDQQKSYTYNYYDYWYGPDECGNYGADVLWFESDSQVSSFCSIFGIRHRFNAKMILLGLW